MERERDTRIAEATAGQSGGKAIEVAGGTMEGKIGNIRRTTFGEASILDQTAEFTGDNVVVSGRLNL
jgi:hypothetical protein